MNNLQGFWSYVQKDDQAEQGRITQLARDVAAQYEILTCDGIRLFLDKDMLNWGDNWKEKIDESLATVAFFIPVITPCFFKSPQCRRELRYFATKAELLGIRELLLPVLYVDVQNIHDASPEDDLIKLVKSFQWEDWRDLRFQDVSSEQYRRGVSRLASRLVEANLTTEIRGTIIDEKELIPEDRIDSPDESAGIVDKLAALEEALPKLTENVTEMTGFVTEVGDIFSDATAEIERGSSSAGKQFSFRLGVIKRTARRLETPVDSIWNLSTQFASLLHDIDEGVQTVIENSAEEIERDPKSKDDICDFFGSIKSMSLAFRVSVESISSMSDSAKTLEKSARDLRPAMRKLQAGLTIMIENQDVTDYWLTLLEQNDFGCDEL